MAYFRPVSMRMNFWVSLGRRLLQKRAVTSLLMGGQAEENSFGIQHCNIAIFWPDCIHSPISICCCVQTHTEVLISRFTLRWGNGWIYVVTEKGCILIMGGYKTFFFSCFLNNQCRLGLFNDLKFQILDLFYSEQL